MTPISCGDAEDNEDATGMAGWHGHWNHDMDLVSLTPGQVHCRFEILTEVSLQTFSDVNLPHDSP